MFQGCFKGIKDWFCWGLSIILWLNRALVSALGGGVRPKSKLVDVRMSNTHDSIYCDINHYIGGGVTVYLHYLVAS